MSYNKRHDARRDDTEPAIIEALEAAGWDVWRELPVDLLCYHPATDTFKTLECKSKDKPLKPKPGKQTEFIEQTGCPIVKTPEAALIALGSIHETETQQRT